MDVEPEISERVMEELLCRKIKTVTCAKVMPGNSKARLLAKLGNVKIGKSCAKTKRFHAES